MHPQTFCLTQQQTSSHSPSPAHILYGRLALHSGLCGCHFRPQFQKKLKFPHNFPASLFGTLARLVSLRFVSFRIVSYALGMVFYPTKLVWFFHLQRSGTTPQCFPFLLRLTDSRFLAATCSVSHSARIQLGSSNPTRATVLFLPPLVVLFTLATSCCCPSCHLCHKNISSTCHRTAAHPKLTSAHTHRPPSFPFCVE